jgi:type III pantothenate kinase
MNLNLVIDIGNSNITLGIYQDNRLISILNRQTRVDIKPAEISFFLEDTLSALHFSKKQIEGVIVASVVSPLTDLFADTILSWAGKKCYLPNYQNIPGITIEVDYPQKVGVDRLVNVYEAYHINQVPTLVIDLGTATTFDLIMGDGRFIGGAIAPGLRLSYETLIDKTDQLPAIDLSVPQTVIGKNTTDSIRSGTIFGYAGLVDSMVAKITHEAEIQLKTIATGGLAALIEPVSSSIDFVKRDLTLSGLHRLLNYYQNKFL